MPEEEVQSIKWFSEPKIAEVPMVGIQGRALTLLYQKKFSVPPGFVLSTKMCLTFLAENKILPEIEQLMQRLVAGSVSNEELDNISKRLQAQIASGVFSPAAREAIQEAYEILNTDKTRLASASAATLTILKNSYEPPFVSVRSSPLHEEQLSLSPEFMNVKGIEAVLHAVKSCYQELLAPQQLQMIASKGDSLPQSAVIIQAMIDADISGSIVRQNESYIIEAVWGLGSLLAAREVEPDHYEVRKEHDMMMLQTVNIGTKDKALTRDAAGKNIIVSLPNNRKQQQLLTAVDAQKLAKIGEMVLSIFDTPYRISFALTQGELHIVGCSPETRTMKALHENSDAEQSKHEPILSEAAPLVEPAALPPTPAYGQPPLLSAVVIQSDTFATNAVTNNTGRLGFQKSGFPVVHHAACSGCANDSAFLSLVTLAYCAPVFVTLPGNLSSTKPRSVSQCLEAGQRLSSLFAPADITLLVPHATQPRHFEDVRKLARTLKLSPSVKLGIQLDTPAAVQLIGKFCDAGVQHIELDLHVLARHLLGLRWNADVREIFSPAVLTALRYVHRQADKAGIDVSVALPAETQLSPHDIYLLAEHGAYAYSSPLSHAPYLAHLLGRELLWHTAEVPSHSPELPPASNEDIEEVVLAQLESGNDDAETE